MNDELAKLTEAVEKLTKRPQIPVEADLWDSTHIAAYLKRSARHVMERLAPMPDFPKAIRLPTTSGGRGDPLWPAAEVIEWVGKYRERN